MELFYCGKELDDMIHEFDERDDEQATFSGAQLAGELMKARDDLEGKDGVATEHDPRKNNSYKFVNCEHTIQNLPAIAQELRDCDTITVETVGSNTEARANQKRELDAAHRMLNEHPDLRDAVHQYLSNEDPFMAELVVQLAPFGPKEYHLIDIGSDDTEAAEADEDASRVARDYIGTVDEPTTERRKYLEQKILTRSKAHDLREKRQLDQLEAIAAGHKPEEDHNIGVISGKPHTPVQHGLVKRGYKTERVFIDSMQSDTPGELARFDYTEQAARHARLKPNEPLPEELLDRALLQDIYIGYRGLEPELKETSREDRKRRRQLVQELIDSMSASEVSMLLVKVDEISADDRAGKYDQVRAELYRRAVEKGQHIRVEAAYPTDRKDDGPEFPDVSEPRFPYDSRL